MAGRAESYEDKAHATAKFCTAVKKLAWEADCLPRRQPYHAVQRLQVDPTPAEPTCAPGYRLVLLRVPAPNMSEPHSETPRT